MSKISVIIPMYNAEAFIEQCIRSVQGQTYRDLEIVVVDDGSRDKGADICDRMALSDPRIRLIRQQNGGVSRARNHGLDAAEGEYIFFLDSDDGIHPRLLEEMMEQVEREQVEMAFCDCALLDPSQMEEAISGGDAKKPLWQIAEGRKAEEWFHITYVKELSRICGLVRRDCIGELRFDETMKSGEDTLFKYRLFCRQVRTAYSPCKWYYYRKHAASANHTAARTGDLQYFRAARIIRESEGEKGRMDYAMTWENVIVWQMMKKYGLLRKSGSGKERRELRKVASEEGRDFFFDRLPFSTRFLYRCCFTCYPLYLILNGAAETLVKWRNGRDE